ncbi:MAG: ribonuclease HI family protein [Candidatus Micrarchaeota archaeon]
MDIYIYTDGASRGNPGKSASGYLILDSSNKPLIKEVFYNGRKTNNFAEYMAIIAALEKVAKLYGYENNVILTSDSEVAVKQINGLYKVKEKHLKELNKRVIELASKFKSCKFQNAKRENKYIAMVDRELNKFLDKMEDNILKNKNKSNINKQSKLSL